MQVIYWTQFAITILLSALIILWYADTKVPLYAKLFILITILCSLACFATLPIDIYESGMESSGYVGQVQAIWKVIYYLNFFMCWLVLPFIQEYEDSGEFTLAKKIKDSFTMNAIMIGLLSIGALLIVILLLLTSQFSLSQIPSIFATLANIFGLGLVSILLGYGLISFPKECLLRKDYKKIVNYCHRRAESIQAEQEEIIQQVYCIRKLLQRNDERDTAQKRVVLTLIQSHFKFQNVAQSNQHMEQLQTKTTAVLHKTVKKRILSLQGNNSQLDELVDQLKTTTQSYLDNNYSRKKIYYTTMFVITGLLSVLIFFAEIATFATFLDRANLLALLSLTGTPGLIFNTLLTAYIAYVVTHTIFRVKIYKVYALHRGHSSASSLLFTAINLSRICYPLCYNYLQITNLPQSAFLSFFGQITLGGKIAIIFPILMLIFGVCNMFDVYDTVMGYLGLGSYAFDLQQAEQKKEEGRNILIERLKERNIENNHLEMIQLL